MTTRTQKKPRRSRNGTNGPKIQPRRRYIVSRKVRRRRGRKPARTITFADFAFLYLDHAEAQTPRSVRTYETRIAHLVEGIGRKIQLRNVGHSQIQAVIDGLTAAGFAPNTVCQIYGACQGLMTYGITLGVLKASPCVRGVIRLPKRRPVNPAHAIEALMTSAEVRRLIDSGGTDEERAWWAVAALTGMRGGEIRALRWQRCDLRYLPIGQIIVAESYRADTGVTSPPKTGEAREVPVHPSLAPVLDAWRSSGWAGVMKRAHRANDLVFPDPDRPDGHLTDGRMRRRFYLALERLGMRRRRIHGLRHTFVTRTAEVDGASSEVLERITHGRPRDVRGDYRQVTFAEMARELAKWEV